MKTSEFIRRSTLGGVARQGRQGSVLGISGSGRGGLRGIGEDATVSWRGVRSSPVHQSKRVKVFGAETS